MVFLHHIAISHIAIVFSSDFFFTELISVFYNKALRIFGVFNRNFWKFNNSGYLRVFIFLSNQFKSMT
jgi:hypothetical protein